MEAATGLSRPTAIDRMEKVAALGFGDYIEIDRRETKALTIDERFVWPRNLDFPVY